MGIHIGDNFELLYPDDDSFVVDDTLVRGGYTIVSTLAERDRIPLSARKEGMVVYVQTPKQEYRLIGGVNNANWQQRTLLGDDGIKYASSNSPTLSGMATYSQQDRLSSNLITKVQEIYANDSDHTFLEIALTQDERDVLGMYSMIRGESSGATAIILDVRTTGVVIPSRTAPVSKPEYRVGTFLQNEHIIIMAGSVIARKGSQLITLDGLNANAISKFGGRCFGQIELRPVYRYQTTGTIQKIKQMPSLGVALVYMDFTDDDKAHVYHQMTISIANPTGEATDSIKSLRLLDKRVGFIIDLEDVSKVVLGRQIKVEGSVTMPTQDNHAISKRYVDDLFRTTTLSLGADSFTRYEQTYDPITNSQRKVSRFSISKELYSRDYYPEINIYRVSEHNGYTYRYKIDNGDIRAAFRSLNGDDTEILIEFWDIEPFAIEVHII